MRDLIFLLCVFILAACSVEKNDDIVNNDVGQDSGVDASRDLPACDGLDESACQNTQGCNPLLGIPFDNTHTDCSDEHFVTCVRVLQCNNGVIYNHQDKEGVCWALSAGCFISDSEQALDCRPLDQTDLCKD